MTVSTSVSSVLITLSFDLENVIALGAGPRGLLSLTQPPISEQCTSPTYVSSLATTSPVTTQTYDISLADCCFNCGANPLCVQWHMSSTVCTITTSRDLSIGIEVGYGPNNDIAFGTGSKGMLLGGSRERTTEAPTPEPTTEASTPELKINNNKDSVRNPRVPGTWVRNRVEAVRQFLMPISRATD